MNPSRRPLPLAFLLVGLAGLAFSGCSRDKGGKTRYVSRGGGGSLVSSPPAVPSAASGLTVTVVAPGPAKVSVDLTWIDNSNDETGFIVQRRAASAINFTDLFTTAANETTYTDDTVDLATDYEYQVIATNFSVDAVASTVESASVPRMTRSTPRVSQ